ncbi:DUF4382 domain-containing protein [Halorubrum sp. LN27]|uniref:DUF4382 domain-containing protein n=1 Tax=Halorubrum sp. LN27 TaxID=2801032 RepID=UPI00190A544D|nr:DUF4382 domain-containing protein [Halorubrum sp. LN27]
MTDRSRTTGDDRSQDDQSPDDQSPDGPTDAFRRREFVALGAGASATLLAGCAGDGGLSPSDGSDGSDGSDDSDGSETLTGNFRLLISDAPADIDDFDQLNVTLDEARIFEASEGDDEDDEEENDADEDEGEQAGNETEEDDSPNGTADEDDDADEDPDDGGDEEADADEEDEDDDEDDESEDDRGFTVVALDGATVDLTQVIEEDAIAVFDGEIPAGSYEKIELSVTAVEGLVDGEEVDVKLPSEKLQITNGFEVTPDEPVSFVFDINVVKRGPNNGYILQPVISGSGVAGRDVEVNEIGDETDDEDEDEDEGDDDEDEDDDGEDGADDGSDEDEGGESGGNETDDGSSDAENGTATNETES